MEPTPAMPTATPPSTRRAPLLVVRDLRTRLRTERGELTAVDGVSFTIAEGETFGIVGESGSGKSVLGRTVMGLHTTGAGTTVTGSVLFDGVDVHAIGSSGRRALWGSRLGMVFQDPMTALNPVKKVGAHLTETVRKHQRLDRAKARARAEELLRLVGIPEPRRRFGQYPHELSGGMRQRVVIAMALANHPKLLIADEPTTALDVTVQKQILDLLADLRTELGMAIVLISHDLGVVAGRTDRVAVMYAGRIVETAPAAELFSRPRHRYTEALLASIPKLADPPHSRLEAIEGAPPDMVAPAPGCAFAPRCRHADATCHELAAEPVAAADSPRHVFACHHPASEGAMR
ncbi:oligopeptide/dipeptide ABC transporter, ATP-binding protein [Saccharomonospora marina XMU15]|uniref:Oligopeptide/dipeptide ABC transporter, ATP-binding protein n=1 Tax=Saccharomonospora marina XMU15 TaxID=882083 RepID=H5X9E0_9PSEU|nr:ABC transporter ATP-binding protein [Saccharomonospora marina]EHR50305.1 oligopeptide/dipeptide ABC transporter, ATP-binding protein [Saccharomonospora marina XMU15]